MKLSVLITTYNLKDYIEETLDSVLMQNVNFQYEILVGDDGSDDGTIEIVRRYMEHYPERIQLFVMNRESNVKYNRIERASKNRLNLIGKAKGQYLIFLDGDDVYIDRNKLQKQIDILELPENQDCVACAHNIWRYWSENEKELINPYKRQFKVAAKTYWRDCMGFHSDTVLFRNVFNEELLNRIPKEYFDDNLIVFSLLEYGDLIYIPDVMVNYRQVGNSSWNSVNELEKQLINLMDWDIELRMNPDYKRESIIRHMYNLLYVWLKRNHIPDWMREKYLAQAKRDGLERAQKWLSFQQQGIAVKTKMTVWLLGYMIIFSFNKIRKTIRYISGKF